MHLGSVLDRPERIFLARTCRVGKRRLRVRENEGPLSVCGFDDAVGGKILPVTLL